MERPADDIFLVNDLSALQSPVPKHLFLGRSSDASSSSIWTGNTNKGNLDENVHNKVNKNGKKKSIDEWSRVDPTPGTNLTASHSDTNRPQGQRTVEIKRKRGRPPKVKKEETHGHAITGVSAGRGSSFFSAHNVKATNCNNEPTMVFNSVRNALDDKDSRPTAAPSVSLPPTTATGQLGAAQASNGTGKKEDSPKIISLSEWSLATVPNSPKLTGVSIDDRSLWVVLVGRRQDMVEAWHSSIVTERILKNHIKTGSGRSLYILEPPMNVAEMQANGFGDTFIDAFKNGFPENWRSLLMTELDRLGKGLKGNKPKPSYDGHTEIGPRDESSVQRDLVTPKRGRGRPRKYPLPTELVTPSFDATVVDVPIDAPTIPEVDESKSLSATPKRGRGRPRKYPRPEDQQIDGLNRHEPAPERSLLDEQIEKIVNESLSTDDREPKVKRGRGRPKKIKKKRGRPRKEHSLDERSPSLVPEMDRMDIEENPVSPPLPLGSEPPKRGRGRPRKYPRLEEMKMEEEGSPDHELDQVGDLDDALSFTVHPPTRRRSSTGTVKWGWGGVAVIQKG